MHKVLNVPSLVGAFDPANPSACAGARRVQDTPTVASTDDFPFVWVELANETNRSGLGRGPWLMEIDVRIHTFSTFVGMAEIQRINTEIVDLIRQSTLTVLTWHPWATPHDRNTLLPFEQLAGIKATELVAMFRLYVEEMAAP